MLTDLEIKKRVDIFFSKDKYAESFLRTFIAEQIENTSKENLEILEFTRIVNEKEAELSRDYLNAKTTRFQVNLNLKPNSKDLTYDFLVAYKINN